MFTVHVTFTAGDLNELDELMRLVRDNEPTDVVAHGEWGLDNDDTPPFGIERSGEFADAAWRIAEHDENIRSEAFASEGIQANEREVITSAVFGTLRDLTYHINDQAQFLSVAHELARDAWGSVQYQEPPL